MYKYPVDTIFVNALKMDFNLLFAVLTSFSFILKFSVDSSEKQDFFLFNGVNTSAHLYRENTSIYLYLAKEHNISIYNASLFSNYIEFSWDDFVLNNVKMELMRAAGEVSNLNFNAFTFTSPIIDFACLDVECNIFEPLHQLKNVNYGYIIAIMIFIAIILTESKAVGSKFIDHIKRKNMKEFMTVLEDHTDETKV